MPRPTTSPPDRAPLVRWAFRLLEICGSLYFALGLLVVLAAVLAWATLLEKWYGEAAARFGVYGAWWFTALGFLLALNILAALLARLPWRRSQIGFVVAHIGLLVLLLGCLITRWAGMEAMLPIFEHRSAQVAYQDSQHFELEILPAKEDEENAADAEQATIRVPFRPGPFHWNAYEKLPWFPWRLAQRDQGVIYDRDGVQLEVLDYCANASIVDSVPRVALRVRPATPAAKDKPAAPDADVRFTLRVGLEQNPHAEEAPYGSGERRTLPGGQHVVFWMTASEEETAAFQDSKPDGPLGKLGRLVLYHEGRSYQFTLDDWQPGQWRALGTTGLQVELVTLEPRLAGARLRIRRGDASPKPMFLSADFPEFNRQDYNHNVFGTYWREPAPPPKPAEKEMPMARDNPAARIDILRGADCRLYLRTWRQGKFEAAGPLSTEADSQRELSVKVLEGTPDAMTLFIDGVADPASSMPDVVVTALPVGKSSSLFKRQVRVRLTVDDAREVFWLGNSSADPLERFQGTPPPNLRKVVRAGDRRVAISLRPDLLDLGLEIKLREAQQRLDPGSSRPSHYSSEVDIPGRDGRVTIKMNDPADVVDPKTGRSYRLFQSGMQPAFPAKMLGLEPASKDEGPIHASYLSVNYDPGRYWKHAGCLLLVAGIFLRYYVRTTPRREP